MKRSATVVGGMRAAAVGVVVLWAAAGMRAADGNSGDADQRSRTGDEVSTDRATGSRDAASDRRQRNDAADDRGVKHTQDPLQDYLARWMAPDDFDVLVKGRTPGVMPTTAQAGATAEGLSFPQLTTAGMTFKGMPVSGVQMDPADNPYLKAMQADAPQTSADSTTSTAKSAKSAQPKLEPPPAPEPKKAKGPVFANPLKEKKEFPQLQGF